jgi:two-component system chemotaxis response regulator CheY
MKTCLVVDDSSVVRKIVGRVLENLGFEVTEAESGQEGLDMCQETMPDGILLDCTLPGMPSTEFIVSLRALANGDKPFVLYCSTENNSKEIARALASGADDYVLKPITRDAIKAKLAAPGLIAA